MSEPLASAKHCATCSCPRLSDDVLDVLEAHHGAAVEAERTGTNPGHECCPDCGDDPDDHTMHADGCRRIGQDVAIQCGPPWSPWPTPDLSPAEQAIVDRFEAACAVCDGYGDVTASYVPSGQERAVGKVGVPTLIPCPVCAPEVPR